MTNLEIKTDETLLKENIKRVLMTGYGERVGDPAFGSKLKMYIFDMENYFIEDVEDSLTNSITKYIPNVKVNSFTITEIEEHVYNLHIDFTSLISNATSTIDELVLTDT